MKVWGISDLHLSFARPDRRDRFAGRWREHAANIAANWRDVVGTDDLVLVPGDVSMARNHCDLQADLAWLEQLPGVKVIAPGNHDQWWNGVDAVRRMLRTSLRAVDGDAVEIRGTVVCGAAAAPAAFGRGKSTPQASSERALASLGQALDHARRLRNNTDAPLYVLWHYPPFDAHGQPGACVEMFERASVTACVYGHLHSQGEWPAAMQGVYGGIRYYCVSADSIGFRPLRIDHALLRSAAETVRNQPWRIVSPG
jgi:predicted phosphohydrolase